MICAVLCDPGPGDVLRFFQGLSEMAEEKSENVELFCLEIGYKKTGALLKKMKPFEQSNRIIINKASNVSELNRLMRKNAYGCVFYCFETAYLKKGKKELLDNITEGVPAEFFLLDRYENQYYIRKKLQDHLIVTKKRDFLTYKALVFVRISSIVPERNLSPYMFGKLLEMCQNRGLTPFVAGSFLPEQYKAVMKRYPSAKSVYEEGKYPDYYQQICDYLQFDFAIGMNSGGLDLAAAAGIPILRIGEFHQTLAYGSLHYNDFLAGARTVNILSKSEDDISNITEDIVAYALQRLLDDGKGEILYVK